MTNYNSAVLLAKLQQQTKDFIHTAQKFALLADVQLTYKPNEKSWSANQCLQHLNSYGNYYLPEMEAALHKAAKTFNAGDVEFVSGWLGTYFTNSMQPKADGTLASKMNSPKDHVPQTIVKSSDVINTFIAQQNRMLRLIELAHNVNMNEVRVPISIARFIKLKVGDVFMFIAAHNHRHILQAQRALQQGKQITA